MSWSLFYFLFVVLIFALFSIFNLKNTCNISFFFYEFKNIPVYTAALFSFIVGIILSFPFLIRRKNKKKDSSSAMNETNTIDLDNKEKKGFFSGLGKKDKNTQDEPN